MLNQAQRRLLLLTATFALSLLSCGREVTGPENGINYGRARFGAVSLDPQMPSLLASLQGASSVVPFERVRVVLRRLDGGIAVDTTVNFPAGADSIALSLLVPLPIDTPQEGLPLSLTMAYMNAAGDTVFRGGPVGVLAPPIGSSAAQEPITIPIVYDGIGKDAARVEISPDTGTRVAGTSSTFTATAFDGANAPIANTPIVYFTLDSARAVVPNAGSGQVTWLANRGVARIVAALPNGARADTAFITVALPASKLVVQSGDAQSGIVNSALGQPIVLRTLAVDDVPVAGVIVTFAAASGNGTLSVLTDTSDANGVVSTNWTLGASIGAQSITATAAGLTGSPATLTATATPGAPAQVAFTQVATAATAGSLFTPPVLVAVRDIGGNLVTSFTGTVSIETTATSSGPVNGVLSVNAVAGVASFANLSFGVAGTYNLVAILDSTARDTSAVITVAPGAGAVLQFVEQPIGAVAGVAFAPPVTVVAKDSQGNIATGFTGTVTLSLLNANGATLGGPIAAAAVNGLATFSGLTVDRVGSSYALAATATGLTADTSEAFGILPAAPAELVLVSGEGQSGPANSVLPAGIVVEVRDAFQNPIPGVTVNFSIVLGDGSSAVASAESDALGRAVTTWTLGPVVGLQVLRAAVPANPLATLDVAATATVGAPAAVAFTQSPSVTQVAGVAFTPQVIVEVRDISGNVVTNYTGLVSLGIDNNPSGATLLGALNVNAVNGIATFPGMFIELAGSGYTLRATTDTLPAATSAAFDVVSATASVVVPVAGDGQTGSVGALLADSLVVRVTDGFGNKVTGAEVVFTVAEGGGSVAPSAVTTNALGEATVGWTLGGVAGAQSVNAEIAGGAKYLFSATAVVGAPTALVLVSGDAQVAEAGEALALPLRVRVTDGFGNGVAGAQVAWNEFAVTVAADTTVSDANGFAQVIATAPPEVGGGAVSAVLVADPAQFVVFSVTVIAAAPAVPVWDLQPNSSTAGTVMSPFVVRVEDAFGNLATSFNGPVTLTAELTNGTPVSVIVAGDSVNAVDGLAEFSTTRIDALGTYRFIADLGALGTVVSDDFTVSPGDPSLMVLVDGDAQSAGVNEPLAAPLRVRVTDVFGNGVSGVSVNWGVISGLAAFTDTVTVTDTNGVALTSVILGSTTGAVSIGAFASGLTGSPVNFTATATAGAAFGIVIVSGDLQTAEAGAVFAQPFVVRVIDAFGNGVSGVQVTFESGDGISAFSDTVATSDANGLAATTATAATSAGNALVFANAPNVSPAAFEVTISSGAATELTLPLFTLAGDAGATFGAIEVRVLDAFGNIVTDYAELATIAIVSGPAGATIGGTTTKGAVDGLFVFDDLVFTTAGSYTLGITSGTLPEIGGNMVIAAGAAENLAVEGVPERTVAAGATVAPPLLVKITDAFGNPVSGETVTWSVASGSITLTGSSSVTDGFGIAAMDAIAGPTAGDAAVTAVSGSLVGSPIAFPITITSGPGALLTLEIGPTGTSVGDALAPFTVAVRDTTGNVATDFVGDVTIVVDSGPSLVITGTTTVAVTTGAATFDDVSFETAGTYRLRFTSPGLADEVSGLFEMLPGVAANLTLLDGDAQSDTVGLELDLPLRIRVTDTFGNGVAGAAIAWSPLDGGAVAQDTTLTDASGVAQVSFTLGTISGVTTIEASLDGVAGSPVLFSATAIPDVLAAIVVTSQPDTVISGAVASAFAIEARDQYDNRVTWFTGAVNVGVLDAPAGELAGGTTTRVAVDGVAEFDDLVFSNTGLWILDFFAAGDISTTASIVVIADAPAVVTIAGGDGQSGVVTQPLPLPLQVLVTDANSNPVVGDTVVFSVTQGGGTLSSGTAVDSVFTNSSGIAETIWTLGGDAEIAQVVEANRAGFATLTFTATPQASVANRTWTGDVDSDPFNAGNWEGGILPVSSDSVLVPAGRPNYPVLSSDQEMARLTVQDGATVELGQWSILVNGSLAVLGAAEITSNDSGSVVLQGVNSATVRGTVPRLLVAGPYTADGDITTVLDLGITANGTLEFGTTTSTIGRDLLVNDGGSISMTGPATLVVERDVSYTSVAATPALNDGVMRVRGNISVNGNFQPSAGHTTNLDGAGIQTVTIGAPDESFAPTCSAGCFGSLVSNKATGGVVFESSVKALGGIFMSGDTLGASGHTIIGVGSTILNSNVTTARRVAYDQSLSVGSLFTVDTMVAFGTSGTVPIVSIGLIPTRVVGSHTITLNHAGDLIVTDDGVLDVDGASAAVGGALSTLGNGRLRMTDASDAIAVNGSATFAGGATTGLLTSGQITFAGDVTQGGGDPAALDISAGVTTLFAPSASSLVSFADPSSSGLGTTIVTSGTMSVLNTTTMRGSLEVQGSSTLNGEQGRINVSGDLSGTGALIVGAASFTGNWARLGNLQPDTVIFAGADQVIASTFLDTPIEWQSIVVEGTATATTSGAATDTLKIGESLVVRGVGARLTFDNRDTPGDSLIATVFSTLLTSEGGTIAMNEAGVDVRVGGFGDFQGGDQTGLLTNGRLSLAAGMTNTVANAFLATDEHVTAIGACFFCDGIQVNVTGGTPRFGTLLFVNSSNALVSASIEADTLRMDGGNVQFPNSGSTLRVNRAFTSALTPTLSVPRLSIGEGFAFDGGWAVDTLIMTGSGFTLPAKDNSGDEIPYNDVVIEGQITTLMANGDSLTVNGAIIVRGEGQLRFNDATNSDIIRTGGLRTEGNGIIQMLDANTTVRVFGPAIFAGGSTENWLDAGTIEFYGDFTQLSTNSAASYRANPGHLSRFAIGENDPVVSFANPGLVSGNSAFGDWNPFFSNSKFINLASNVFTLGQFQQTIDSPIEIRSTDVPRTLTVSGADIRDITFRAVSLQIEATAVPLAAAMPGLNFEEQDPEAVQLSIIRAGTDGVLQLENPVFNTIPNTGLYLSLQDNVADVSVLEMNVVNPAPAFHSGRIQTLGGAILTGWPNNGPGIWTGLNSTDFNDPGNWQSGFVPQPTDSISIDDGASQSLIITSPVTIGALSISGATLEIQDSLIVSGTLAATNGTLLCSGSGALRVSYAGADSVEFGINAPSCDVVVADGRVYQSANASLAHLFIRESGVFDVNGHALSVSALSTLQNGVLEMTDEADAVRVATQAVFQGGDETGRLSAGFLEIKDSFLQGGLTNTSFVSSGTHRVFLGDSTTTMPLTTFGIDFNDPTTSTIHALTIFDKRAVGLGASVTGELRLALDATLVGGAVTVGGGLRAENNASVAIERLALTGQLFIEGAFSADTVDFLGAGETLQQIPATTENEEQITYGTLRVLGDSAQMKSPFPYVITDRLEVGGQGVLVVGDASAPFLGVVVNADSAALSIEGDALLRQVADGEMRVKSASFNGGDLTGLLTRGDLVVHGDFTQQQSGAIGSTFVSSDQHRVVFDGTSSVSLENPSVARFGGLVLTGEVTLTLLSDITIDRTLEKTTFPTSANVVIQSNEGSPSGPRLITVGGGTSFPGDTDTRTTFVNVALRLEGDANAGGGSVSLADMTFQDMNPAATYLDVQLANYSIIAEGMDFATAVTTGKYFEIVEPTTTITFQNSTPAIGCIGAPEGCVGPRFEPSAPEINTWTGADDANWLNAANWDALEVPSSFSDVIIPVTGQNPVLVLDRTVHNLTVAAGASLFLDGVTLGVTGTALEVAGTITQGNPSVLEMRPPGAPATISGGGTIAAALTVDAPSSGSETTVTLTAPLLVTNNLTINANTFVLGGQTLKVGDLFTANTGRLEMTNPTDSVDANNVEFNGESTEGLLTDGKLVVRLNFFQGNVATSFAADAGHETIFTGGAVQQVVFLTPSLTESHFGRLRYLGAFSDSLMLNNNVFAKGPLIAEGQRAVASDLLSLNRVLQVEGFDNSTAGQTYFGNVSLFTSDTWGLTFASSLFFQNMSIDVPQLRIAGLGGTVNIAAVTFTPLGVSDPGVYLQATDLDGVDDFLTVNIPFRSPEGHDGRILLENGAVLTGWDEFALYTFTGAVSSSFDDPDNWDVGVLPTSTSNVLVDNESGFPLGIESPVTIKKLTTAPASAIVISEAVFTTGVQGGFDLVQGSKVCTGNGALIFNDPSPGPTNLRADVPDCDVIVLQGNVNLSGDFANVQNLQLEGGFFNVAGLVNLTGNLTMTGSSVLFVGDINDSLVVQGDASFRGNQAWLSTGNVFVRGDLDVGANSDLAFRMEGNSQLAVGNPGQPLQSRTISIDPGSQMYVDSLVLYDGTTTVEGTLRVRRHLAQAAFLGNLLTGGTVEIGDPANATVGTMTSGNSGAITLDRLAVYGAIPTAGSFSPDTTDFLGTAPSDNGGIQKIRAANSLQDAHDYKLVRVFADAIMDQVPTGIPFAYEIANGLHVLAGQLTIGDSFTQDTVYVSMANADLLVSGATGSLQTIFASRVTADSVHFESGATSTLSSGLLRTRNLVQRFAGAPAFAADLSHVLELFGTGRVSIENVVANPLFDVRLFGGATTSFDSDLVINGTLGRSNNADGVVTLQSVNPSTTKRTLIPANTDFGVGNSGVTMRNVGLLLQANVPEPGANFELNNVTFQQMDPLSTFIALEFSGSSSDSLVWGGINFDSPVTAEGRYFDFQAGLGQSVTFLNATPAAGCLTTICLSGNSAPSTEPGATWNGNVNGEWDNALNWSTSAVPTADTDVTIPSGTPSAPTVIGNRAVKSLTVEAEAILSIFSTDTLSVYGDLSVEGTITGGAPGAAVRLVPPIDTASLSVPGEIQTHLAIGTGVGGYDGVVELVDRVNLTATGFFSGIFINAGLLNLNGHTLQTGSNFQTFGSGRFKMTNPLDTILVGESFRTRGGSTDGLLTEGEIVLTGTLFRQFDDNSLTSFVATGNHSMRFSGGGRSLDVWFESPDSTLSRFANLAIDRTFDQWVNFDYSRVFVTNLTKVSGRIEVFNDGFGVGQGSDGELIVSGTVSDVDPAHMIDMVELGTVRLLGVNQLTCDGLAFNVQYNIANFLPTICHSPDFAWAPASGTESVTSYGAYAASDTDIWVVGESGTIQRGDGSTWTTEESSTSSILYAVHGTSAFDVWAVGEGGTVVHFDGVEWTLSTQGSTTLRGVFAFSPTEVYAVGDGGTILRFDGSAWTSMTSNTTENLTSVFALGPSSGDNNLLVTGTNGTVLRLVFGGWTVENSNVGADLNASYSSEGSRFTLFGAGGTARRKFSNSNTSYFDAESPTIETLWGAGGNGTEAFAVGAGGTIVRLMGESLVLENSLITDVLYGVTVTPNGTVYIAGANGLIHKGTILP